MLKKVVFCIAVLTMAGAAIGSAAALDVRGGTIQEFNIDARVELTLAVSQGARTGEPDILRLTVRLPAGYDPTAIEVASVSMSGGPAGSSVSAVDFGIVGGAVEAVFSRPAVMALYGVRPPPHQAIVTVTGTAGGLLFSGTDTIDIN